MLDSNFSANPPSSDLTSDVLCGLCGEIFTEPRTLACNHSFCTLCLQDQVRQTGENMIVCPTCRYETYLGFSGVFELYSKPSLVRHCEQLKQLRAQSNPADLLYADTYPSYPQSTSLQPLPNKLCVTDSPDNYSTLWEPLPSNGEKKEEYPEEHSEEFVLLNTSPNNVENSFEEDPIPEDLILIPQILDDEVTHLPNINKEEFAQKLIMLREMGFNDIKTNAQLLLQYDGDLQRVTNAILTSSPSLPLSTHPHRTQSGELPGNGRLGNGPSSSSSVPQEVEEEELIMVPPTEQGTSSWGNPLSYIKRAFWSEPVSEYSIPAQMYYYLKFKIPQEQIRSLLLNWLKTLWLAPSGLLTSTEVIKVRALYVPFWVMNISAETHYHIFVQPLGGTFQLEEATLSNSYPLQIACAIADDQDRALITAPGLVTDLKTWKENDKLIKGTIPPDNIILEKALPSNLVWEQYLKPMIIQKEEAHVHSLFQGKTTNDLRTETNITDRKESLIYLPSFVVSYNFNHKNYSVVVNGINGQVYGERPYFMGPIGAISHACISYLGGRMFGTH